MSRDCYFVIRIRVGSPESGITTAIDRFQLAVGRTDGQLNDSCLEKLNYVIFFKGFKIPQNSILKSFW